MKSAFGLSSATIDTIHAILKRYPEIEKAVIYGSRAKGNFREGSDIDLTLFGNVGTNTVADVMDALEESNLPYLFDVSAFELIENEKLREHIGRVGREFYRRDGGVGRSKRKGWEIKLLGEVCETSAGGTPLKAHRDYYEGGKIPWLLSGEVSQGEIFEARNFITEKGLNNSSAKLFPKDTVLVAMYGATAGQVGILRFEAATNQAVCGILPNSVLTPEFLYYCFLSKKDELVAQAVGGAQPNISQIKIRNTSIPLPPLPEQKRIVVILDKAFSGIARAKEIAEKNLANAREISNTFLNGIFLNSSKKWEEKKLFELCEIKHGYAFEGEFFSNEGEYILLTPGNFFESGGYRDRGGKQKYFVGKIPRDFLLSEGDLLVAMTEQAAGLLGSPILVPESGKFLHNQRLGLIKSKPNVPWVNEFFFHVFNTWAVRQAIHNSASGVKVRHTSPTKIGEVSIRFPASVKIQRELVAAFNKVSFEARRLETIYRNKIIALASLKTSLLHQAFSGALTKGLAS